MTPLLILIALLIPPYNSGDYQEAYRLLSDDQLSIVSVNDLNRLAPAMRAVCTDLELLDPASARYWFRGEFENANDFFRCYDEYRDLRDAPYLEDRHRFAWAALQAPEVLLALRTRKAQIETEWLKFPDRFQPFAGAVQDLKGFIELWEAVQTLGHPGSTIRYQRHSLKLLRSQLTPEEWALGVVPRYLEYP